MSETPRYRCASERGFFAQPTQIMFAKLGNRVGFGQRAEQDDEFWSEGDPAKWWDPVNDEALARVEALVKGGKRKKIGAETAAQTIPLKAPPRSGMTRAITDANAFDLIKDVRTDEHPNSSLEARPAPRRRSAAKSN